MPQIGAAGAGVPNFQRMFSSPVPPSPEIITEYIAHLTTLSSPAILVSGIRAIPGSRGVDFEVFEEATKRNEIGLLLGGLRVLLHDKDPCRVESALPLLQVLNAEAEYALRRSESGNGFTRASALWLLGGQLRYLKVPQVPTTLETLALYAANSEDPRLRSAAPGVLLYCSSKSAQKAWEKLTKDQLSSVRCAALRACLQRGVAVPEGVSLQSIESLQRTAEAPCDFAAAEAAAACLRGGSTQTQLRLIELAADESRASRLRAVALSALERSPLPAAQEALFAQLSSAEDEVAAAAARTLRMGSAAALRPRILEQAKDPNRTWGARKYAVQALGRKTTSIEQKALLEFMTSSDATAALDAAQCLADAETCFVRPQLVRTVEGQLVSGNPLGAMSSVVALGRVRTLEERYLMMKALGHSFSVVRQAAAEVMLRTGSDALDSPVHLSKVQDVVMGAGKEGIAREVELAEALHFLFVEAGIV
jgi:HEAT repeat protein